MVIYKIEYLQPSCATEAGNFNQIKTIIFPG